MKKTLLTLSILLLFALSFANHVIVWPTTSEQWNYGSNTLAIRPGEIVVYSRNYVTNQVLQENGIKLHIIPSSELSRGGGGPRCMCMPLVREDIY